jgi:autotransporter-associated beta strand protein
MKKLASVAIGALLVVGALTTAFADPDLEWYPGPVNRQWDFASSNWSDGVSTDLLFTNGAHVCFTNQGAGDINMNTAGITPGNVRCYANSSYNFTLDGSEGWGGTGRLIKANSGTLTVYTTNTFTGPTEVRQGTLRVSSLVGGAERAYLFGERVRELLLPGDELHHGPWIHADSRFVREVQHSCRCFPDHGRLLVPGDLLPALV